MCERESGAPGNISDICHDNGGRAGVTHNLRGDWTRRTTLSGKVTMTAESSENGAMTLSRMNFSGCVGHATMFCHVLVYRMGEDSM